MKGLRITIKGFRFKGGKLTKDQRRLPVSERLWRRSSKHVRVIRNVIQHV